MKNENEKTIELLKNLPKDCFSIGGVVYPKSQWEEVLTAWFGDKPLPKSKKP